MARQENVSQSLRLPFSVHQRLSRLADADRRSFNNFVSIILIEYLEGLDSTICQTEGVDRIATPDRELAK